MSEQFQEENLVVLSHNHNKPAGAVDIQLIIKLLKNPFEALKLDEKRDILYGLIGIGASLVGYIVLVLMFSNYLKGIFLNPLAALTGVGAGMGPFIGKMILLGILSLLSLFVSLWLISWWQGEERQSIQGLITKLGAMQYMSGAGFIIAGLLALMTIKLAFAVLLIVLISTLIFSVQAAFRLYKVKEERSALYIISSVGGYFIVMLILTSILM